MGLFGSLPSVATQTALVPAEVVKEVAGDPSRHRGNRKPRLTQRYLPRLFLAAAAFGLVGTLPARHINWRWAESQAMHVFISSAYIFPHQHR